MTTLPPDLESRCHRLVSGFKRKQIEAALARLLPDDETLSEILNREQSKESFVKELLQCLESKNDKYGGFALPSLLRDLATHPSASRLQEEMNRTAAGCDGALIVNISQQTNTHMTLRMPLGTYEIMSQHNTIPFLCRWIELKKRQKRDLQANLARELSLSVDDVRILKLRPGHYAIVELPESELLLQRLNSILDPRGLDVVHIRRIGMLGFTSRCIYLLILYMLLYSSVWWYAEYYPDFIEYIGLGIAILAFIVSLFGNIRGSFFFRIRLFVISLTEPNWSWIVAFIALALALLAACNTEHVTLPGQKHFGISEKYFSRKIEEEFEVELSCPRIRHFDELELSMVYNPEVLAAIAPQDVEERFTLGGLPFSDPRLDVECGPTESEGEIKYTLSSNQPLYRLPSGETLSLRLGFRAIRQGYSALGVQRYKVVNNGKKREHYTTEFANVVIIPKDAPVDATLTATALPTPTPTHTYTPRPSPTQSATEPAASGTVPAESQTPSPSQTSTATATRTSTTTPTIPEPTATVTPVLGPTIRITVEGLDRAALECSMIVFFRGLYSEVERIPLYNYSDLGISYPSGKADWFAFFGSADGTCPWNEWSLSSHDADRIEIGTSDIRLQFRRVPRPSDSTDPKLPTKKVGR